MAKVLHMRAGWLRLNMLEYDELEGAVTGWIHRLQVPHKPAPELGRQ